MIGIDDIVLYGEPFAYVNPMTGEASFAGTAVGLVLGGTTLKSGQALILNSWTNGLEEWPSGENLVSLVHTRWKLIKDDNTTMDYSYPPRTRSAHAQLAAELRAIRTTTQDIWEAEHTKPTTDDSHPGV